MTNTGKCTELIRSQQSVYNEYEIAFNNPSHNADDLGYILSRQSGEDKYREKRDSFTLQAATCSKVVLDLRNFMNSGTGVAVAPNQLLDIPSPIDLSEGSLQRAASSLQPS
jgi:hypothetical protein